MRKVRIEISLCVARKIIHLKNFLSHKCPLKIGLFRNSSLLVTDIQKTTEFSIY